VGTTDYTESQVRVADRLSFSVELVTVANMLFQFCVILLCAALSALPLGDRWTVVSVCCHHFMWSVSKLDAQKMCSVLAVWLTGELTNHVFTLSPV
jgi:hypothetical protein